MFFLVEFSNRRLRRCSATVTQKLLPLFFGNFFSWIKMHQNSFKFAMIFRLYWYVISTLVIYLLIVDNYSKTLSSWTIFISAKTDKTGDLCCNQSTFSKWTLSCCFRKGRGCPVFKVRRSLSHPNCSKLKVFDDMFDLKNEWIYWI